MQYVLQAKLVFWKKIPHRLCALALTESSDNLVNVAADCLQQYHSQPERKQHHSVSVAFCDKQSPLYSYMVGLLISVKAISISFLCFDSQILHFEYLEALWPTCHIVANWLLRFV